VFLSWEDADRFLKEKLAEVARIKAGLDSAPPVERPFSELCDRWLEHRAAYKRSGKDDASIIRRHLRPFFGGMALGAVGVAEVEEFRASRSALSPKTVRNVLTLLQTMLRYAVELGWLTRVPVIKKPRIVEQPYSWLRTADAIGALLSAAMEERAGVMETYAVAVYSGMRAGEILGLQWDDVDLDRRLILVARSYDKPATKNGKIRYVPILDPLVPVLEAWRRRCPSEVWVFPMRGGTMQQPAARVLQETFHRCLARAGLERIRFHDLRHTFASHWVMRGGDIFKLQRILGHSGIQMTMRDAHLAPDAFAEDLGRMRDVVPRREGRGVVVPWPS